MEAWEGVAAAGRRRGLFIGAKTVAVGNATVVVLEATLRERDTCLVGLTDIA